MNPSERLTYVVPACLTTLLAAESGFLSVATKNGTTKDVDYEDL